MPHGRIGGDAGTEKRRGSSKIEVRRNAEHKALGDDDAFRVPAVRDAPGVLVGEVVGESHVGAELLESGLALWACAVGVHETTDCREVARPEFGHGGPNLGDATDNLMTGDAGVDGGHDFLPLIARLMEIRVADAAEKNFNLNVVLGGISPCDRSGSKRRCRTGNGISFGLIHEGTSILLQMAKNSPVNQTTKEYPSSGILILPISCLFLSIPAFLCTVS
jgi:hypothetical protein